MDRAKAFYADRLGFSVDHDTQISEGNRIIQLTPPGSGCSIVVGEGIVPDMPPGSLKGLQLVVPDIHAARDHLRQRGVEVSEIQVMGESPALSRTRSTTSDSSSSAIRTATVGPYSRYLPAAEPKPTCRAGTRIGRFCYRVNSTLPPGNSTLPPDTGAGEAVARAALGWGRYGSSSTIRRPSSWAKRRDSALRAGSSAVRAADS